jgi:hypothetical protein
MRTHWGCYGSEAMANSSINFTGEISKCSSKVMLHFLSGIAFYCTWREERFEIMKSESHILFTDI